MQKVILYGSRYGSTEIYAKELANKSGLNYYSYKQKVDLSTCDTIVYIGSLFGGKICGLSKVARRFPKNAKIILVTTGILDITTKDNFEHVKKTSLAQLPSDIVDNTVFYALMGKAEYGTMKWYDKAIMSIVHKGMSQKPESERTPNEKIFIDNFKTCADMIDLESLNPILAELNK